VLAHVCIKMRHQLFDCRTPPSLSNNGEFPSIVAYIYTTIIEPLKDLQPPDIHYLNAAQGWLGLNDAVDAQAELDKISAKFKTHLFVLEVQWQVHAKANNWEGAIAVARTLTKEHPKHPLSWIHLAYALHELRRTKEAYDLLTPVLEKFPREWLMRYNMACYAVQLGNIDEGKQWLERAHMVGDKHEIAELVATDPDLEPLRKSGGLKR
jgi:predicted Zn-dependent protease